MPSKFEVYKDRAGKYRFRLKAIDGQVMATSFEPSDTAADAVQMCATVQEAADGAVIVDLDNE